MKTKTITIHNLDEKVEKVLRTRAKTGNTSVNKAVKELLQRALGLGPEKKDNRVEFLDLFGIWTEEDERSFSRAIRDLETIDRDDWT
ncbi:MAG: hypothetical protein WCB96_08770 [Candidatus Aminicenantales bacterium]